MMVFLRYMTGFFLQLFLCMLLCILPFGQRQFRWGLKRTVAVLSLVVLGMSAGLPGFLQLQLKPAGSSLEAVCGEQKLRLAVSANGYMAVCILLGVALCCLAVRTELCKRLLSLLLAFVYGIIEYMTANLFVYFVYYNSEIYSSESVLLYAISTAVTFPVAAFFIKKRFGMYLMRHSVKDIYKRLGLAMVLTVLYGAFVASIGPAIEWLGDTEPFVMYLPYGLGYLFGTVFLCTAYWYMFWEMEKALHQNDYKHQLNIQKLRYEAIRGDMEAVRRMKHDLRHHFRLLANFLADQKVEEARQYLENMNAAMNSQEAENFCGEPAVNALLQYYIGEARSRGIACHVKVRLDKSGIEDADMTVILGNCLENAIRACKEQKAPAFIRLKMGVVNSTLAILLENTSPEVAYQRLEKGNNGFWSVDKNVEGGGGIGLVSVASTVEKYDGTVEFKYENGVFYSRISMEIPGMS